MIPNTDNTRIIKFGFSSEVRSSERTNLKFTMAINGAITKEIIVARSTRALKFPIK